MVLKSPTNSFVLFLSVQTLSLILACNVFKPALPDDLTQSMAKNIQTHFQKQSSNLQTLASAKIIILTD